MSLSMLVCVLIVQLADGPSEARARHMLRKGPAIRDLSGRGMRTAYSAPYGGCHWEGCACGIPPELLHDVGGAPLGYVALNIQNTAKSSPSLARPIAQSSKLIGMYNSGRNCGRWVEITHQEKCVSGETNVVRQPPVVCGIDALLGDPKVNFVADGNTGIKSYALVADGCADNSYWCRNDVFHLGFSPSLQNVSCGSGTTCMNSRRVDWKFIDAAPEHIQLPESPQFAWHCQSNFPGHALLMVYNVQRGVSHVIAEAITVKPNKDLGQQFMIPPQAFLHPDRGHHKHSISVEVQDINGDSYGTFEIPVSSSYVTEECSAGKWAAKVASGQVDDRQQATRPVTFEGSQELGSQELAVQLASASEDKPPSDTASLTSHFQADENRTADEDSPLTGLHTMVTDMGPAGRSHGIIQPVDPIEPSPCMPNKTNCAHGHELLGGFKGQTWAVTKGYAPAVTTVDQRDGYDTTGDIGSVSVTTAWALHHVVDAADAGGSVQSTEPVLKLVAADKDRRGTQDHIAEDPLQLHNDEEAQDRCSQTTRHAHLPVDRGIDVDVWKKSCTQSGAASGISASLPDFNTEVLENQTDCSAKDSCARQKRTQDSGVTTSLHASQDCQPVWSQCGGKYHKGVTCCVPGHVCRFVSQWYSQCQPLQL